MGFLSPNVQSVDAEDNSDLSFIHKAALGSAPSYLRTVAEVSAQNQENSQNARCSLHWLARFFWGFFWVWGSGDDLGPACCGLCRPTGTRPARDYPTAPGKDV